MKCLHCGKSIPPSNTTGWHKACVRRFFGLDYLPQIYTDEKSLELLANQEASKGRTVPGVQKKLSLRLSSDEKNYRLTVIDYPTGYILKPQVKEFEALPQAEHLVMLMANKAGISTVPHALIFNGDKAAYITKRIDRIFSNEGVKMLAMEDFCQLDLRLTQDKYKGSYERCAKIIQRYSSRPGLDLTELFLRLVFSYLVGNSDMHLKNFSLIETTEGSSEYILSPAYDLIPVNIILPEDKEETALAINGKKSNLRKNDFLTFSETCQISKQTAERMIAKLVSMKDVFKAMCEESYLPDNLKISFIELIEKRSENFS
ncbi:MAG TPA: HipA domain-containing protein [Clostridiales bacterium]|jgi:serine/threonine-protein kinase HipA|nr:HipA domain-containing protein [Clostridiales bacterium]HRT82229.1 HipA domain-containing protein [Oscillospiraceae bacterium]